MIYFIKFIFFLLFSHGTIAADNQISEILFKINNKVYTNTDLEKRKEYVALINDYLKAEFSESENKEILDDYISSLIFYEYYIENKIFFQNLNDEIDLLYKKKINDSSKLNKTEIKIFKFNIKIDLIRNKIIEEKLNFKKNNLLQEANTLDLLYNYNLQYLILKENLIEEKLIANISDRKDFNDLKIFLKENKINFFFKEEDINNNTLISKKIKDIIKKNLEIYSYKEKGYISLLSINKSLESYEGIFVKLINFTTIKSLEEEDLKCNKLDEIIEINKTVFKEYEYTKLNDNIKKNLKSINDFIIFKDNNSYNYIILCDLKYDEKLLKNINFNKNVNSLVKKIQKSFLKKYKNEYKYIKIK